MRLAAVGRRRGHGDHGQQRLRNITVAAVIANGAAVREQHVDQLGEIERGTVAQAHHQIHGLRSGIFARGFKHRHGGAGGEVVERENVHAARLQRTHGLLLMARIDRIPAGDYKTAGGVLFAGHFAQTREFTGAKQNAGTGTEIERSHCPLFSLSS